MNHEELKVDEAFGGDEADRGDDADAVANAGEGASDNGAALSTGDAGVDAAVARLGELDALPLAEQVGVYEDVHRGLGEALNADFGSAG